MELESKDVKSTNIKLIRFTTRTLDEDGVLLITFANGSAYSYDDVPVQVAKDFLAAESQGKFFFRHIRDQYVATRQDLKEGEE